MIYEDYNEAEFDLVLFSKMYKYENKFLYLHEQGLGCVISNNPVTVENSNNILAIAINGILFVRSE